MSRKLGGGSTEEQLRILSQLEEEKNPRLAAIDDYDRYNVILTTICFQLWEYRRGRCVGVEFFEQTICL